MRSLCALLLMAVTFGAAADTTLRVVPVTSNVVPFRCGDRCRFRAAVPAGPLRLRIFRGTIAQLEKTSTDPRYVGATGCVEYYSMIIRTRNPRRPQNVLDLRFYFRPRWLNGTRDGHFVFIVEHDDNPNGPELEERPPTLRLPTNLVKQYFRSGIDITIQAPVYAGARAAAPAYGGRGGETAAMMAPADAGDSADLAATVRPAPPRPTPTTAAANDCNQVQFENTAIPIRRADGKLRREDPLQLADQRR